MPTFRKFLKRFAPKWMGSSGASRPSKSSGYDISQNKQHRQQHRQQRTGYAQFDGVELHSFSNKEGRIQTTVVGSGGSLTDDDREVRAANRDDTSEEAILDERSIAYTRTFDIKYSR